MTGFIIMENGDRLNPSNATILLFLLVLLGYEYSLPSA